jgi:hypothetical protein
MKYNDRIKKEWLETTKEDIRVEAIGGAIYAFCSELAALRLYYKYRKCDTDTVKAAYSANMDTWYFCLELK